MAVVTTAGAGLAAARAGATVIQLRAPLASARELLADATSLVAGCPVPVLVSSRVDVALLANLAGVHLPERDIPVAGARRLLGPDALIGRSVHSVEAAIAAAREDAGYVVFGPVFETPTHPGAAPAGLERLAAVCRAVDIPVLAIGGVTDPGRVAAVLNAGAAGHASISAFSGVPVA